VELKLPVSATFGDLIDAPVTVKNAAPYPLRINRFQLTLSGVLAWRTATVGSDESAAWMATVVPAKGFVSRVARLGVVGVSLSPSNGSVFGSASGAASVWAEGSLLTDGGEYVGMGSDGITLNLKAAQRGFPITATRAGALRLGHKENLKAAASVSSCSADGDNCAEWEWNIPADAMDAEVEQPDRCRVLRLSCWALMVKSDRL
jgi:hypothetical protein